MQIRRLTQFGLILIINLSLLLASFSICFCEHASHHTQTGEHQEADSEHSHESETLSHHDEKTEHHHNNRVKTENTTVSLNESECCCPAPSPKVLAKNKQIEIKKQALLPVSTDQVRIELKPQLTITEVLIFSRPFYLSDSFHNLHPGRAPPRL